MDPRDPAPPSRPAAAMPASGPWWATALRWIGVLLLLVGVLLTYVNRTFVDPEGFADRTVAAVQDPAVSDRIAQEVTDQLIAANPDLIGIRPLLVSTVSTVVSSDPVAGVVRVAAEKANALAFSEGGNDLLLNLKDLRLFVRDALAVLAPDAAAGLEEGDLTVSLPVAGDASEGAVNLWQLAETLRWGALVCVVGGSLLVLAGVLLSRSRRRALLGAGAGIAFVGTLLAVLVLVGELAVRWGTSDPAFVAGLYNAFLAPLLRWGLVLAFLGVVLAAAAAALLDRIAVGAWLAALARTATHRPGNPLLAAVHALALVTVGVLVVLHPTTAVALVAVLAGVVLVFLGLRELLGLVAGPAPRAAAEAAAGVPEGAPAKPVPWRLATASLLVVALLGVGVTWIATRSETAAVAAPADGCNGSEALCERRVDEVRFAGTHNSMAAADVRGWLFPNHERNIPDQLDAGVRALLIDINVGTPTEGGVVTDFESNPDAVDKWAEFVGEEAFQSALRIRDRIASEPVGPPDLYLCHGFCELGAQPLVPVLSSIRAWMVAHPGEVVLMVVQDDGGTPEQIGQAFDEAGLSDVVWRGDVPTKQGTGTFPTLGEMVEENERLMVFAENSVAGGPEWYHLMYDTFMETPFQFEGPDAMGCEPNRGGTDGSLFLVNNWIETMPPRPSDAAVVNAPDRLRERVERCEAERGATATVIAVDFYLQGDVVGVTESLNTAQAPVDAGS